MSGAVQLGGPGQWLPPKRPLTYSSARVGRWLYTSCYSAGPATPPPRSPMPGAGPAPVAPVSPQELPAPEPALRPRSQVGRWILDYTAAGDPHVSTPATSYEYSGHNVSGWPDTPALLTIACDSPGNWINLVTWRNIWPWGDSDVVVRHRLGAGDWTHDAWTRRPQYISASTSHWTTRRPLVADATAADARSLTVALYDRDSWESTEQLTRRAGFSRPAQRATLLAHAEFSLKGIAETLEHLDGGRPPAP